MALGKYSRIDGHNSSNYCLTVSIAVFISTCLIGAWMTVSSSINPLRVGVTLQQFMGGMPKKGSENLPNVNEDTLKVNASQGIVQDDKEPYVQGNDNLNSNVPQSSEAGGKHENQWVDEKESKVEKNLNSPIVAEGSVSGEGEKKGTEENIRRDSADANDEKVTLEESTDAKEGNAENIVNTPFVAGVTISGDGEKNVSQRDNSGRETRDEKESNAENIINAPFMQEGSISRDGEKKVSQGDNNGSDSADTRDEKATIEKPRDDKEGNMENIVYTSYVTEGSTSGDGGKKGPQEKDSGEYSADTNYASDQKVAMEKALNSAIQKNDYGKESTDERIKVGEMETNVEETEKFEEKKPSEKEEVNAMRMQDGETNKFEKSGQGQSKSLGGDSSGSPLKLVSDDTKEMFNETTPQAMPWPTQAAESEKERPSPIKEITKHLSPRAMRWPTQAVEFRKENMSGGFFSPKQQSDHSWKVCNVTAGPDYIPCLDNIVAIKKLRTTAHYEHRERHCPEEAPTCLVHLPLGYRIPIKWPKSRDMIWFTNVPHTKLAEYKGGQNWVKILGQYLTFPGGGTQFKYGALHYIDYLQKSVPDIAWGKRSRVALDVGCGVASFGGYLFDRDVLTMSLAPKDEHEAQVQFALERGIPAISAVMGTKRLPFPSRVFDIVHCARCRVPWHIEGGKLLLELNRVLRPGGYFVWSATPVYRKDPVNAAIWKDMSVLTKAMCWELVKVERDQVNRKAAAIFRKPTSNDCYEQRSENDPPLCEESDDPDAAWYTPLVACIHKVPTGKSERGSQWPLSWPLRLEKPPYWLKASEASFKAFTDDYDHWKKVIASTYLNKNGIDWSSVRNVMDMRASYGGFAAALRDLQVWVMNVVTVNSSDTLPIIYERGLFGIYHDWCESFSTYPRSYGLLHADKLFSDIMKRCNLVALMAEVDRILRPGGWLLVRDDAQTISEVENSGKSLHWKILFSYPKDNDQVLCLEKTMWRPSEVETVPYAIGHAGSRA